MVEQQFGSTDLERDLVDRLRKRRQPAPPVSTVAGEETPQELPAAEPLAQGAPGVGRQLKSALTKGVRGMRTTAELGSVLTATWLAKAGIGDIEKRRDLEHAVADAKELPLFGGRIGALREVQKQRDGLFWGDKPITELVGDPLTYVGWGFLGKIPLAGKVLGPMEHAYLSAVGKVTDIPIAGIGKLAKRLPQPPSFRTRQVRDDAFNAVKNAFEDFVPEGTIESVTSPDTTKEFMEAVLREGYQEMQSPARKAVLELVRSSTVPGMKLQEIARIAGRRLQGPELTAINDVLSATTANLVSRDQAVEAIIKAVGQSPLDEAADLAVRGVVDSAVGAQRAIVLELSRKTPLEAAETIANRAAQQEGLAIHEGIAEWRRQHGVVGAAMNEVDAIYTTIWRNGIERFAARPLAEAVLGFWNLGPMNLLESMSMVLAGQATPRFLTREEFAQFMRGRVVDPDLILGTRSAARAATPVGATIGPAERGQVHLPGFGEGKWELGRLARDFGNNWIADLKRGYFVSRMEAHTERFLEEAADNLAKAGQASGLAARAAVESIPVTIPEPYRRSLLHRARIALTSGNPQQVRQIAEQFTEGSVLQREVNGVIAKADLLDPQSRQLLMQTRRVDDISSNLGTVRRWWEENLQTSPEWLEGRLSGYLGALRGTPPSTRTELAAAYNALNHIIDDGGNVPTALMEVAYARRRALVEGGEGLKRAGRESFDDIYETQRRFTEVWNRQMVEAVKELNMSARRLGISSEQFQTFSDLAMQRARAWADWWTRDELERKAHFLAGGSVLEWTFKRGAIYAEYKPRLEEIKRLFSAKLDDMAAVIRATPETAQEHLFADKEKLLQRYLLPKEGILSDPRLTNLGTKFNTQLTQIEDELRKAITQAPIQDPADQKVLKDWLEGIAKEMEKAPVETEKALRDAGDKALSFSKRDLDRAFINYNSQNTFDFVMRHAYPFWMYESRVWQRLARVGLQSPKALSVFGPGGSYWDATDNGYGGIAQFPIQVAPIRGTMLGRLRRVYQRSFPEYEAGLYGKWLKMSDTLERWGFYPGLHINAPVGVAIDYLQNETVPRLGEYLPPAYETALSILVAGGAFADVPKTEQLRRLFVADRFKDRALNTFLFSRGVVPSEASPEERRSAIATMALYQAAEAQVSLTRYHPQEYDAYRESRDNVLAMIAGITPAAMKELREQGRDIRKEPGFALDPFQRRQLRLAMGSEERVRAFSEIGRTGLPVAEQKRLAKVDRFWESYDTMSAGHLAEQQLDDAALAVGDITGKQWRDRRGERGSFRRNVFDYSMKLAGVTEEDMESAFPKSEMDKALDRYYDVTVREDPVTKEPNWRDFYRDRERVLGGLNPLTRAKVVAWTMENSTPVEARFKKGQLLRWGDYFDKRAAAEWYISRYGDTAFVQEALQETEGKERELQRLVATQASQAELRLARRETGEQRLLNRIQVLYRRDLAERQPEIKDWLRQFYGIVVE